MGSTSINYLILFMQTKTNVALTLPRVLIHFLLILFSCILIMSPMHTVGNFNVRTCS